MQKRNDRHSSQNDLGEFTLRSAAISSMGGDEDQIKELSDLTMNIYEKSKKYYHIHISILIFLASLLLSLFIYEFFYGPIFELNIIDSLQIFVFVVMLAIFQMYRWLIRQYDSETIEYPIDLNLELNQNIDLFLKFLAQDNQSRSQKSKYAYCRRYFSNEKEFVDLRYFLGRFRYLHFSSYSFIRSVVASPSLRIFPPSEIYISGADLAAFKATLKPTRKGGPGIKPAYPYLMAGVSVALDDPLLSNLDFSNEDEVIEGLASPIHDGVAVGWSAPAGPRAA